MASSVTLKALGLNKSPNHLDLPNGSLTTAENVVIRRDNVVEQRRGFKIYGDDLGSSLDRAKQLFSYKGRLLRQYATSLQYDDGEGTFSTFNGTFEEAQTDLRTKSIESNGNFYFTSADGIKLISASSASQFTTSSGYVSNAGVPKAIDFKLKYISPDSGQTGFLAQDSAVAYRTVWAIKDANSNTKLGSPSQSVSVYASLLELLIVDYLRVLEALDNINPDPATSFFVDADYVNTLKIAYSASAATLRTNLLALATKIDNDILYADDAGTSGALNITGVEATSATTVRITVTGTATNFLEVGSKIYLAGFGLGSTSSKDINGAQVVTAIAGTTIDFVPAGGGMTSTETFAHTSGTVVSNIFRSITQPSAPSTPATEAQLSDIQDYLFDIITALQALSTNIIPSTPKTNYITPLDITETINVRLTVYVPDDVTTDHFLQIYRSTTVTATGTDILADLVPDDEMQLVYEAYPTSAEISAGEMVIDDITPDIFKGANLYTNPNTGEGILQANDVPPFALDINKFKNVVFYANTKTRHRLIPFSLVGVTNMVTDALAGTVPTITVANEDTSNTYTFTVGAAEVSTILCVQKSSITNGSYFDLNSANDINQYRFYLDKGSATPPSAGGRTLVAINISHSDISTDAEVAAKVRDVIAGYVSDFTATLSTATVTVTNVDVGYTTNVSAGTSGFTVNVTTAGTGENVSTKEILLSQDASPAIAVDETARSMVRVINGNSSETIYAFYTSTLGQVPGKMVLESRTLSDTPFYLISNNSNTGESFFPIISPVVTLGVSAGRISVANPTVITSASHGLANNDEIIITDSNSTPSINGIYTVTVTGANTFTIPVNVTVAGTKLSYSELDAAEVSQNEEKTNRIYYSKLQQPEAVPILNYIDVGAEDKAILRIFPLRDSLFIFKEDGLFRISGETAPFYLSLFDSSCICVAPDSVSVANNLVYAFTRQGISTVSEAGVVTISRPIDIDIIKISSAEYADFATATWGVGYESDNSYLVFTVTDPSDEAATIAYRYSNLTNSWTTFDKDSVCGIVNPADDKLYLGAGDTNSIEQERKSFTRLDYADREISSTISDNTYTGSQIQLATVNDFEVGDVIVQEQYLTAFKYNALLQKLDTDPSVAAVSISAISAASTTITITATAHNLSTTNSYVTIADNTSVPDINGTYAATYINANQFSIVVDAPLTSAVADGTARLNYYETLGADNGANLRTKIVDLAAKLDTDPGLALTNYSSLIASKTGSITAIAVGNPSEITSASHGLQTGRYVLITSSNSTPSIDGSYTVTRVSDNVFSIAEFVNTAGTTGSFATDNTHFNDIKGCFNLIINNLNSDTGAAFTNYRTVTETTSFESVITDINIGQKKITLGSPIGFVVGPITLFKAIESTVVYSPNIMGDPLGLKHVREATIMFANKAFTSATLSFATDLLPKFIPVDFNGSGNGVFGSGNFGDSYFGGSSNSSPFRTIIPRNCQRCRYIVTKFVHNTARESYAIFGVTLTGEVGQSTRAYR